MFKGVAEKRTASILMKLLYSEDGVKRVEE
jgi:hypothetical protein